MEILKGNLVVGRSPQENTSFGNLIHELTGNAIKYEIFGMEEVHAIDAAVVHFMQ